MIRWKREIFHGQEDDGGEVDEAAVVNEEDNKPLEDELLNKFKGLSEVQKKSAMLRVLTNQDHA